VDDCFDVEIVISCHFKGLLFNNEAHLCYKNFEAFLLAKIFFPKIAHES
jgi:hypothetical protein